MVMSADLEQRLSNPHRTHPPRRVKHYVNVLRQREAFGMLPLVVRHLTNQ